MQTVRQMDDDRLNRRCQSGGVDVRGANGGSTTTRAAAERFQ